MEVLPDYSKPGSGFQYFFYLTDAPAFQKDVSGFKAYTFYVIPTTVSIYSYVRNWLPFFLKGIQVKVLTSAGK